MLGGGVLGRLVGLYSSNLMNGISDPIKEAQKSFLPLPCVRTSGEGVVHEAVGPHQIPNLLGL